MAETNLFVFGDSLSDTGNSFAVTGLPPFPYFEGRFSNGEVAVEYLASALGESYSLDPENNYAFGGATTGQGNSNEDDVGMDLPGLRDQIDAFVASTGAGGADPNGLYIVWAGPNDFLDHLGGATLVDPADLLRQGTLNLLYAAETLSDLGAEDIVLPNMVNLGTLPSTQRNQVEATAMTKAFNASVALALGNLDFDVTEVDVFATGEAIAQNPSSFGFSNVTTPLLELILSGNPPENPQEFFWWDRYHTTTQGHAVLGDTIYKTLTGEISQPSFVDIIGTPKADLLNGTAGNDNIDGLAGKDSLSGFAGGDRIEGWGGSDQIFGGGSNDILQGNAGDDVLWGGAGDDTGFGGNGNDELWGQAGNDILIGDAGNDITKGGDGDDFLLGGQGEDVLWGEAGRDFLQGGSENDVLLGGIGDDRLDGGEGSDRLDGGEGGDRFVYHRGSGVDKILDFTAGADQIDLSSFKFENFTDFSSNVGLSGQTIDFGEGDKLKLALTDVATLTEADVILV